MPIVNKIGITQKVVVFDRDGKFLTIQRSKTAPVHALCWDLPGGELEYGEDPVSGIKRETTEEAGIEISNIKPFDVYGKDHGNDVGFWVTIAYRAEAVSTDVKLSYEHDDFKWVTAEEFLKLPSSEKLVKFIENV